MGNIQIMDERLATLIAAGEVVENPASVVKELLENALDAQATKIELTLKEGGRTLIQVKDNGCGMDEEDIHLATRRHATSKLKTMHDLYHIHSLGFRGEALASIAQVAKLTLESSTTDDVGIKLVYDEGKLTHEGPSEARQGTTIRVQNLFYHTPARLKYLKTTNVEYASVVNYVHKLALAHPTVAFTLWHDDKKVFQTTGDGDSQKILYAMYGASVVKDALEFHAKNQYYLVQGSLIKPSHSRSIRQHMHVLVNGRIVTNDKLLMAIKRGYQDVLPPKHFPLVFLSITCDPLLLDVNIHPQKLELKFTEEANLYQLIETSIQARLRQANLILKDPYAPKYTHEDKPRLTLDDDVEDLIEHQVEERLTSYNEPPQTPPTHTAHETQARVRWPELEYIGQAQGTYLIFQGHDGLYLMDQHAAAERIRYERYYEKMQENTQERQPLLVPFHLTLSQPEVIALSEMKESFNALGVEVTFEEGHTLAIHQVPRWFAKGLETTYAEAMVVTLLEGRHLTIGPLIDQLAKDLACKHSVKGNTYLSRVEVDRLLTDLKTLKNPFHCPHGRPTLIHWSTHHLEQMFGRINL